MKILIIKSSSLGDIIHLFPVINYLKEKNKCTIDWVVEAPFAELVSTHPLISKVIRIHTKKWRKKFDWQEFNAFRKELRETKYDLIFDLQSNLKSSFILALARGAKKIGFGRKSVHEWPNLFFTNVKYDPPEGRNIREDYLSIVQQYFGDELLFKDAPVTLILKDKSKIPAIKGGIIVAPGSAWPNKQISMETLLAVLKKQEQKELLFVWKSDKEREFVTKLASHFPDRSHLLPSLSLPELQYLISQSSLVIAMDSLILHLCGMIATPSLSFFGPSLASKYAPLGPQHKIIQGSCPYGETFVKRCSKLRTCKTGACLKDLIQ